MKACVRRIPTRDRARKNVLNARRELMTRALGGIENVGIAVYFLRERIGWTASSSSTHLSSVISFLPTGTHPDGLKEEKSTASLSCSLGDVALAATYSEEHCARGKAFRYSLKRSPYTAASGNPSEVSVLQTFSFSSPWSTLTPIPWSIASSIARPSGRSWPRRYTSDAQLCFTWWGKKVRAHDRPLRVEVDTFSRRLHDRCTSARAPDRVDKEGLHNQTQELHSGQHEDGEPFGSTPVQRLMFAKIPATWCGHRRRLALAWARLLNELRGEVPLVELNYDTEGSYAIRTRNPSAVRTNIIELLVYPSSGHNLNIVRQGEPALHCPPHVPTFPSSRLGKKYPVAKRTLRTPHSLADTPTQLKPGFIACQCIST
ncbi:hypothetical protein BKA70DRAFT_1494094 [Coprinopsis sp. MPI-PUGE-AT-0042]|nr:hypothetical protein BKA70DRAFT_1494094 [Coprinopsis sp. MPI-PUGE-AT-0042]